MDYLIILKANLLMKNKPFSNQKISYFIGHYPPDKNNHRRQTKHTYSNHAMKLIRRSVYVCIMYVCGLYVAQLVQHVLYISLYFAYCNHVYKILTGHSCSYILVHNNISDTTFLPDISYLQIIIISNKT